MNEAARRARGDAAGAAGFNPTKPMAGWMSEIVPYGIFTTDRELRVKSWNEWLTTHSGLAADEVIGRRITEIFPDLIERRLQERYIRALEGEISVLSTALHKYLLPVPVPVADSGLPHMLQTARIAPLPEGGVVAGTITIIEDVTQREVQAGILSRQQELDRMLSSALATLLQSHEPAEEMTEIFATVRLALGLDSFVSYLITADQQTLQLNGSVGISPKQRESIAILPLEAEDQSALCGPGPLNSPSFLALRESLAAMGVRGQGSFPLAVGERILGLVAFGSYERETIAAPDGAILSRIARYVAIALDRARRERDTVAASRAKDDFLAALSHELRTPLNPVLLVASDAMANPNYPAEAREAFRVIEKNALLEARLIDDLLDLTRIAHGKLSLDMQPFDVHSALRDALETVRVELEEQDLSLEVEMNGDPLWVAGDSARLQQVFWNVLKNAVKFTARGGRVRVQSSVDREAKEVSIVIADTGIGMDERELARVFEAFAQGDHAEKGRSHRFGGLGLGLAISRRLVELHSGRILAASAGKSQGATFTIILPLAPNTGETDSNTVSAVSGTRVARRRPDYLGAERILLVEDHEPTRQTLSQLLIRRGFQVVSVTSMESAMKSAETGRFDLVLSDIGLPDGDGFILMQTLREKHGLRGIALTGYGMEEDLVRSGDAGFLTHLTKPISVKVLDRALAQVFPGYHV